MPQEEHEPSPNALPPPGYPVPSARGAAPRDGGGDQEPNEHHTPVSQHVWSALLLGDAHTEFGESEIEAITPNLAIGISRGRFPKGYPHVDPNEDAVFAASTGTTTVLAVADGHNGFDAARAAITAIAESAQPSDDEPVGATVRRLATTASQSVAGLPGQLPSSRVRSGTSLTVVAFRDGTIASTTLGDSACFITTRRRATRLGETTEFLTATTDPDTIRVDTAPLPDDATAIIVSDGILDFTTHTKRLLRSAARLPVGDGADHLIAAAFSGGAGDNLALGIGRER